MSVLTFDYTMELSSPMNAASLAHEHAFTLRCVPQETKTQHVLDFEISVEPKVPLAFGTDGFGNSYCFGNIHNSHEAFRVNVKGKVQKFPENFDDASEESQMIFRHESEMTKAGETIKKWNSVIAVQRHGNLAYEEDCRVIKPDNDTNGKFDKALFLRDFVHEKMAYVSSSTNAFTTAEEAAEKGKGVCQDFAQIMISLCRLQKIPCRYVAGILKGEGKSHAWVECAVNGKWIPLDPTNPNVSQAEQIIFSRGRDSLDCEINRGVYRGSAFSNQKILAELFVEE